MSQNTDTYRDDDEWMTVSEATEYTKISRATLYRLMEQGTLPYYRVVTTRQRRFKRSDLDQLMVREEPGNDESTVD